MLAGGILTLVPHCKSATATTPGRERGLGAAVSRGPKIGPAAKGASPAIQLQQPSVGGNGQAIVVALVALRLEEGYYCRWFATTVHQEITLGSHILCIMRGRVDIARG